MIIIRTSSKKVKIKKPPSPFSKHGYTERNKNLRVLGFRSYGEYINSEMWKLIRKLAFESNGTKCVSCGTRATQIHHSSYDLRTLAGSDMSHLHPVCSGCHESAELDGGIKVHHRVANSKIGVKTPSESKQGKLRRRFEREEREQPHWRKRRRR